MAAFNEALLQQMQEQIAQMQTDLAASAAATDTATAAAGAATAALNALPPDDALPIGGNPDIPQLMAPVFALLPALMNAGAFLDLNSISGAKRFKSGDQPLSQMFDFSDPSDLQVFLDLLKPKTRVQGWSRVFTVPVTTVGLTVNHSLLSNYGLIPLAAVTQDALSYVDTQTKVAQDLFMAFQCIFASLETDFLKTITTESRKYHVGQDQSPSGSLPLKAIIMRAHVDTRATVTFIREALSQLDVKMSAFDSNITKFNIYVKSQVICLEARGESTNDLLVNVFKGYQIAQDEDFAQFVKRKKDAYDEGADITVASLMDVAENKYKTRLLTGEWSAPTKEQEQILALTAQVDKLGIAATPTKKDKQKNGQSNTPNHPENASKAKLKRHKKWAWQKILPKEGEPVTKVVDGTTYHLECEHHPKQWVCHTSAECSKNPKNNGVPRYSGDSAVNAKKQLKAAYIAAAAAVTEHGDDMSDGDPDGY
jgi:hypothetical protein